MAEYDYLTDVKKRHPKPFFTFPVISPFGDLSFEELTPENSEQLFLLFENDFSPFVDDRFKTAEGAREYATWIIEHSPWWSKHGGKDWLFKVQEQYAGILHLYDMSLETFALNNKRCWIGFATQEAFRRKGYTTKALRHFIDTIFRFYPQMDFIHAMTLKENTASAAFLLAFGFQPDLAERLSKEHHFFLLTRKVFYATIKSTEQNTGG